MDITVITALIVGVFGAGGLTAFVNALKGWRDGKAQTEAETAVREQDAEERHIARLERRLGESEDRIRALEAELRTERAATARLTLALVRAGIDVPGSE